MHGSIQDNQSSPDQIQQLLDIIGQKTLSTLRRFPDNRRRAVHVQLSTGHQENVSYRYRRQRLLPPWIDESMKTSKQYLRKGSTLTCAGSPIQNKLFLHAMRLQDFLSPCSYLLSLCSYPSTHDVSTLPVSSDWLDLQRYGRVSCRPVTHTNIFAWRQELSRSCVIKDQMVAGDSNHTLRKIIKGSHNSIKFLKISFTFLGAFWQRLQLVSYGSSNSFDKSILVWRSMGGIFN